MAQDCCCYHLHKVPSSSVDQFHKQPSTNIQGSHCLFLRLKYVPRPFQQIALLLNHVKGLHVEPEPFNQQPISKPDSSQPNGTRMLTACKLIFGKQQPTTASDSKLKYPTQHLSQLLVQTKSDCSPFALRPPSLVPSTDRNLP